VGDPGTHISPRGIHDSDGNWQQLLAIWNRAKGKEKDALLWGDEVGSFYKLGICF
jgi:hypothetical protein